MYAALPSTVKVCQLPTHALQQKWERSEGAARREEAQRLPRRHGRSASNSCRGRCATEDLVLAR